MKRLITLFSIFLLSSCASNYGKYEVTKNFKEIKELNQILIAHKVRLEGQNTPETISTEIPQTRDLIQLLKTELNLTEIEFHHNIKGKRNNSGFAYRFGNPASEKNYSFLIFAQNQDDLELFRHYEQFVDCGKFEVIDKHWAFSRITVDCNN